MTQRQPHTCPVGGCINPCRSKTRKTLCVEHLLKRQRARVSKWRKNHKKEMVASALKWNREHPAAYTRIMNRYRRLNVQKIMFRRARQRARNTGLPFTLKSWADIPLMPKVCPVLGLKLQIAVGVGRQPNSPSLDRINSSQGYILGNVRIISRRANELKRNATLQELVLLGRDGQRLLRRQSGV